MLNSWSILHGDVMERIAELGAESVDCIVTSPPYLWLRDYEVRPTAWPSVQYNPVAGLPPIKIPRMKVCLGLEKDPWAYHLVLVFREMRRVLKRTGSLWLNLGDKHLSGLSGGVAGKKSTILGGQRNHRAARAVCRSLDSTHPQVAGLKPKDMLGLPWRVALALQADGWWLRQDMIWEKPNPQPESTRDRPSRAHEYLFLLVKTGRRYFYDADAISELVSVTSRKSGKVAKAVGNALERRNARTVWRILPDKETEGHTATFAGELARRAILAGCPVGGIVLDPFSGLAKTGVVSISIGRRFIGIELNDGYAEINGAEHIPIVRKAADLVLRVATLTAERDHLLRSLNGGNASTERA